MTNHRLTNHLLTMNTNDGKTELWVTCECGWRSETMTPTPATFAEMGRNLVKIGNAHQKEADARGDGE